MGKFGRELRAQTARDNIGPKMQVNAAGAPAFIDNPLDALYKQVASSLWSGDGYYEKHQDWLARLQANIGAAMQIDPEYPFRLAAFARSRTGLKLRTTPLALYAEASALSGGTGFAREYGPKIMLRADEPAEIIAYWKAHKGGMVPHGIRKGMDIALRAFDEYQLAKYRKGTVSLRDVLRIVRPKPVGEDDSRLWKRALTDELATPYTWEVEISSAHGEAEKRDAWNKLIGSGKLGTFAIVRNIRNIANAGADIEGALEQITEERVQKSGILPFQWYKAWKAISEAHGPELAKVMMDALEASLGAVKRWPGVTVIVCDNSGSMSSVEQTRGMSNAEIANLMGAMSVRFCDNAIAATFGDSVASAPVKVDQTILQNKDAIDRTGRTTGHSTNAWLVFKSLTEERIHIDRLLLFSDMQCWDTGGGWSSMGYMGHSLQSEFETYRKVLNPNIRLYTINLATQDNTTQFIEDAAVMLLAGFSESIFAFISALEDSNSTIKMLTGAKVAEVEA